MELTAGYWLMQCNYMWSLLSWFYYLCIIDMPLNYGTLPVGAIQLGHTHTGTYQSLVATGSYWSVPVVASACQHFKIVDTYGWFWYKQLLPVKTNNWYSVLLRK